MVPRWRLLLCLSPELKEQNRFSDLTESDVRLTSVLAGTVTILLFGAAGRNVRVRILPYCRGSIRQRFPACLLRQIFYS